MSEVQFHIHRRAAFAGALLPCRIYINGQYIGTIHNGKSLRINVHKADTYYIEDDILFSGNAVIYDNGSSEYKVVIKRTGGWCTESYNEFYIDKGDALEQLPYFRWEKLLEMRPSMSQSERTLALCFNFWMFVTDDLQELFASEHLFEIIAALQKIGAHEYHNLILGIMNNDLCDVRLPLNDDQIEQMQPEIEDINRAFWSNKSAKAEFHEAITSFLIAMSKDSNLIF